MMKPDKITEVPGFLDDLPEIRRELAGYYTNVRRLDDALGAVLGVLKEEGFAENTLVMFYGGDHGMSFPVATGRDRGHPPGPPRPHAPHRGSLRRAICPARPQGPDSRGPEETERAQ